jgi:hypothetical protein
MESKQGGGEVSEDYIPGSCKYETYTMRTLANKYLCNGCNRFGREVRVTFYAEKDSVFKITSIEVIEEGMGIYREAVLANKRGDAYLIKHFESKDAADIRWRSAFCLAYRYDLQKEIADVSEQVASVKRMPFSNSIDEIVRQLGISYDRHLYNYSIRGEV